MLNTQSRVRKLMCNARSNSGAADDTPCSAACVPNTAIATATTVSTAAVIDGARCPAAHSPACCCCHPAPGGCGTQPAAPPPGPPGGTPYAPGTAYPPEGPPCGPPKAPG